MKNDEEYYYKTKEFIFSDKKEELKQIDSDYGFNFDSTKRRVINNDYSKVKAFTNKLFYDNYKNK